MKSIWKFIIVILSIFICFDLAYADKFNVRGYQQGMMKKDVSWSSMIGYDGKEYFDLTVYFVNPGSETEYHVTVMLFAFEDDGTSSYQVTFESKVK